MFKAHENLMSNLKLFYRFCNYGIIFSGSNQKSQRRQYYMQKKKLRQISF